MTSPTQNPTPVGCAHRARSVGGWIRRARSGDRGIPTVALAILQPLLLVLCTGLVFSSPLSAATQVLTGTVPAAVAKLRPMGRLPVATQLNLAIGLPLRNPDQLNTLLSQIYDPTSPNYRHYLTPAQFAEMFGPTQQDYQALIRFAAANRLTVISQHPNRLLLDVQGSVTDIEKAFQVTIYLYEHPTEARSFYSPNVNPTLKTAVPVLSIHGLDNYSIPRPNHKVRRLSQTGTLIPNSGSGPGGAYLGNDLRAAYVPGTPLTGAGQNVGLLQFDGYYANDIASYIAQAGISTSVVLTNIPIDGGVSTPGPNNVEVCLDIEMVIAMAPGVSKIFVYEAPNPSPWVDLLSRMANDNQAKQLSASWLGGGPDPTANQIFLQMAAQGQSFFNASGDDDAWSGVIPFPADNPNITAVGGTTLATTGPAGSYVSEIVWNLGTPNPNGGDWGSSGGISTLYPIPTWQLGLSMSANQGSTTMRNIPDVAMVADNVAIVANNGQQEIVGGTSCAAPLWAGLTALINQQAGINGLPSVGLLNPALYAIGKGENYLADFHDVTIGNNFTSASPTQFIAVAGYDLCTGWGTPAGTNLINALTSKNALPGTCLPATQTAQHPFDITRNALYWFTHGYTNDPICATATLEQAIAANGGTVSLGFLCLPTANYTSTNVPAISAFMEALGFYYKGSGTTGDGLTASALCQARKKMAPELIAAIANNVLLGTTPDHAKYVNAGVLTNFPSDLIEQAGLAAVGTDVAQVQLYTALLRKFNASGITNAFFAGLGQVECSPNPPAFLRKIARDPTTYLNCPGLNDSCSTAENVAWNNSTGLPTFQRTVDTRNYAAGTAYWKIVPPLGATNRKFTANTAKSNFPTTLTVLRGNCAGDASGLAVIASQTSSNAFTSTQVSFTTDGAATFYITAAPVYSGTFGKLKFTLTSP